MGHTAVLFVHGIGRHRRHANAGSLLEALERVADHQLLGGRETIIEAKAKLEPLHGGSGDENVASLTVRHARRRQRGRVTPGIKCRIYEVNWSPDTRGKIPVPSMLGWIAATAMAAFRIGSGNWLKRARLRLARLHMLLGNAKTPGEHHVLTTLAATYRLFRGSLGAAFCRDSGIGRRGRFSDLFSFCERHAAKAVQRELLKRVARRWRDARLPAERRMRLASLSMVCALVLIALTSLAVWRVIERRGGGGHELPAVALVITLVIAAIPAWAFFRFLSTVLSDVRYWAAVSENDFRHDTRMAILRRTISMIRHILADASCDRLVIVSHSLGTAIAFEALRELGRYNRARDPNDPAALDLHQLDTLVTLGSPIDKLACLFESTDGRTWREELLREQIAGDLSSPPFLVDRRQEIKWINFWDRADPVSDPLFTPLGLHTDGNRFVTANLENIEVINTPFYDPGGSHVRYLRNPAVMFRIYREIFAQHYPLPNPIQPGTIRSRRRTFAGLTITVGAFAAILLALISASHNVAGWLLPSLILLMASPITIAVLTSVGRWCSKGLAKWRNTVSSADGTGGRA